MIEPTQDQIEVIGLGQASLDYLGRLPYFPDEDLKVELQDIQVQCGGPASTAMVALSRLGVKATFIGSISDDPIGVEIKKGLKEAGLNSSGLKISPDFTSQFAFITVNAKSGARTIFWHRGTAPPLKPEDINLDRFSKAKILHLDGLMIEASLEAARQAKELGIKVVLDAGTMRKGSKDLVSLVNTLIASEGFAHPLLDDDTSPQKSIEALRELGPDDVVITLGSKGSVGWNGRQWFEQKAYPVRAVDTTGAGDVYHGAYVYGLLKDWDMGQCMRFASAVAAIKCKMIGARQGIPSIEEVHDFMNNYPDIK